MSQDMHSAATYSVMRSNDEGLSYSRHMKNTPYKQEPTLLKSSSSPPKRKNLKKLSLSTAAAQKLGPSIEISSPTTRAAPLSAGLGRRMPMKLPSLNMGLVRRPSLPVMTGKEPPETPLDKTFSVIKELNPVTAENDKEIVNIEAYQSGPICILSPNLWLYSEPSAAEAQQFDVVINVAKEVRNPLAPGKSVRQSPTLGMSDPLASQLDKTRDSLRTLTMSNTLAVPSNATTDAETLESPVDSIMFGKTEYVHMPWDHNETLETDLPILTAFIDRRLNLAQKRVLIHCQQGVSRSATLVIAYIMKTQSLDVNEAYAYVKSKSSSIGPNMSLIYQLCEWGKTLQRMKASTMHRRSFDVGGAKTAPSGGTFTDSQPEQRKRATSSATERMTLERTKSDQHVSTTESFSRLGLKSSELETRRNSAIELPQSFMPATQDRI